MPFEKVAGLSADAFTSIGARRAPGNAPAEPGFSAPLAGRQSQPRGSRSSRLAQQVRPETAAASRSASTGSENHSLA